MVWNYSLLVIHSPNMWWTLWIIYKKITTVSTKKQKLWTRSSVWVLTPAGSGVDLFSLRQQQEIWNRTEEVGIKRTNSVEFFHSAAFTFWACRHDWKSQLTLGFCPARLSSYVPNACLEAFVALKLEVVITALITLGHSGCTSVNACGRVCATTKNRQVASIKPLCPLSDGQIYVTRTLADSQTWEVET